MYSWLMKLFVRTQLPAATSTSHMVCDTAEKQTKLQPD